MRWSPPDHLLSRLPHTRMYAAVAADLILLESGDLTPTVVVFEIAQSKPAAFVEERRRFGCAGVLKVREAASL